MYISTGPSINYTGQRIDVDLSGVQCSGKDIDGKDARVPPSSSRDKVEDVDGIDGMASMFSRLGLV